MKNLKVRYFMIGYLTALFILVMLHSCDAHAEPTFCSVEYFKSHELKTNAPNTKRLHSFKIGTLELSGLAVGESDKSEVASMSPAPPSEKYCTWYFNYTNDEAKKLFNWAHVPGPYLTWFWPFYTKAGIADDFERALNPELPRMLTCVEHRDYLAGGCDAEKHRGPSVFAWFLSVAGCEPRHSTDIANQFWGLNGVKDSTRLEIATRGFVAGGKYPEYRSRLQKVMSK